MRKHRTVSGNSPLSDFESMLVYMTRQVSNTIRRTVRGTVSRTLMSHLPLLLGTYLGEKSRRTMHHLKMYSESQESFTDLSLWSRMRCRKEWLFSICSLPVGWDQKMNCSPYLRPLKTLQVATFSVQGEVRRKEKSSSFEKKFFPKCLFMQHNTFVWKNRDTKETDFEVVMLTICRYTAEENQIEMTNFDLEVVVPMKSNWNKRQSARFKTSCSPRVPRSVTERLYYHHTFHASPTRKIGFP